MFAILCAILMSWLYVDEPAVRPESELRSLYSQASQAISARDFPEAIRLLESLTVLDGVTGATPASSESAVAEVAAFHLAECYLITNEAERALQVLRHWTSKIAQSLNIEKLQPGIVSETPRLAFKICQLLPNDIASVDAIRRYLSAISVLQGTDSEVGQADRWVQLQISLVDELVRRQVKLKQFAEAQADLARYQEIDVTEATYRLTLAWAHHELQLNQPGKAVEILTEAIASKSLPPIKQATLHFQLSEALAANGQPNLALESVDDALESAGVEASVTADWITSLTLRRCELLLRCRRYREAIVEIEAAKKSAPTFEQSHEFDYLLARCEIANADFDSARHHLAAVASADTATGTDAVPRARWMIGETYFLQRNYTQALEAYLQVVANEGDSHWRARSLLQAAKCYELIGSLSQALMTYQQIKQEQTFRDESLVDILEEAEQRMSVIRTTTAKSTGQRR